MTAPKHPRPDAPDTPGAHYTFASVAALVGEATAEDHALYDITLAPEILTAEGRKLGSSKVCTDALRWCGETAEAWAAIPEPERDALAFDPGLLRVLFSTARTLDEMLAQHEAKATRQDVNEAAEEARAAQSLEAAARLYTALHAPLLGAAQRTSPELAARVSAQPSSSVDAHVLADALESHCALARELLAHPASPGARWLLRRKIDAAWLANATRAAATARTDSDRVEGARRKPVSQAALDAQDGRVLALMDTLRTELSALHSADPRMPLVHPIATRSYFLHPKRAHVPAEPAPPAK